jgi:hypothetical protein
MCFDVTTCIWYEWGKQRSVCLCRFANKNCAVRNICSHKAGDDLSGCRNRYAPASSRCRPVKRPRTVGCSRKYCDPFEGKFYTVVSVDTDGWAVSTNFNFLACSVEVAGYVLSIHGIQCYWRSRVTSYCYFPVACLIVIFKRVSYKSNSMDVSWCIKHDVIVGERILDRHLALWIYYIIWRENEVQVCWTFKNSWC